jgi:hypothetical protein
VEKAETQARVLAAFSFEGDSSSVGVAERFADRAAEKASAAVRVRPIFSPFFFLSLETRENC